MEERPAAPTTAGRRCATTPRRRARFALPRAPSVHGKHSGLIGRTPRGERRLARGATASEARRRSMTSMHRVVVTGVGQITPLAFDEAALRARLFSGESAVRRLEGLDASAYRSQSAAQIDDQTLAAALSARAQRPGD